MRVSESEAVNAQSPQVLTVTKAATLVDVWANYRADGSIPTGGEFRMEVARSTDAGASFAVSSAGNGPSSSVAAERDQYPGWAGVASLAGWAPGGSNR
ncbi:MAG TPA: hypothetical protein VJS67_11030 [Pseudonocardiaceae bacterium]|nr:hypothetical protein [Pseudonocardiaceae bacterium]